MILAEAPGAAQLIIAQAAEHEAAHVARDEDPGTAEYRQFHVSQDSLGLVRELADLRPDLASQRVSPGSSR